MTNIPNKEQVRKIFKDTYSIYKLYNNYELFKTMINLLPFVEPDQATEIMSETYVFYQKHKDVYYDDEWFELCEESKIMNKKYNNNDFCRGILKELLDILEVQYTSSKMKSVKTEEPQIFRNGKPLQGKRLEMARQAFKDYFEDDEIEVEKNV